MKKEKRLFLISLSIYIFVVFLYSVLFYYQEKEISLTKLDTTMYSASLALDEILGKDFHDKYNLEHKMPLFEYHELVKKLNRIVDSFGIEFIYSMAMVDGRVYFVTSNESKDDMERGTFSVFYNPYDSPPKELFRAFENGETIISHEYSNQWDTFRSIFVPKSTPQGFRYVLAADMKMENVHILNRNTIMHTLTVSFLMLFAMLPVVFLFRRHMRFRERELLDRIYKDALTALPNATSLIADIKKHKSASLILINIDSFREINDIYGAHTGDIVLKSFAKYIDGFACENESHACFRLYKIPADEYVMAYFGLFEKNSFENYIKNLQAHISRFVCTNDGEQIYLTATIGAVLAKEIAHHEPLGSLNIAKNIAQKNRRDYVILESVDSEKKEYVNNILWLKKTKEAIVADRIVPFYQPIIDNSSGKIVKYEALMRMLDDDGSVIAPYSFLGVAKKSKLDSQLTKIMIDKSFKAFEDNDLSVSLNLSTRDLVNKETIKYICEAIEKYEMQGWVTVEILESESVGDYNAIYSVIKELKSKGCKIAIDDFGSGYSNFDHILRLEVDFLKIDGSLIKNILDDRNASAVVPAILLFARELGIKTIAEFVHSESVQEMISSLGVDYSQGYHIGKPSPYLL